VDYRKFLRRFAAPREVLHADTDAFDYIYYTYGLIAIIFIRFDDMSSYQDF
jgi:hypothetical protein